MAFVPMSTLIKTRGSPIGYASLNQIRQNVLEVEQLRSIEHLANGKHNARETPWVIGHINGTTGYMFDTAYGGGTITQPATGTTAISMVSGVVPSVLTPSAGLQWDGQVLANVSDADVANTPHLIGVEVVSATSIRTYVKRFTGALGVAGNTWADVDREHDVAFFGPAVDESPVSPETFNRFSAGQYLFDEPEYWQAIARDQHALKSRIVEHRDDGSHWTPRVPFAQGWFYPTPLGGPYTGYSASSDAQGIASVVRNSTGVVTITTTRSVSSVNLAVCFPQGIQGASTEVIIVNGRCVGTNTFMFYVYVGEPGKAWKRDDRTFSVSIFGSTTT